MSRTSRTVLIVDNSPEDCSLYRRYLLSDEEYFYTIYEATLGQQGSDLWEEHQPDIVLLDYQLPDLDGLEFLAKLQPNSQQPCLPVIMVTGCGNEAIAVQAMKAGAQDYLVKKHITPSSLRQAVNGAIFKVQQHTQLQQRIQQERLLYQQVENELAECRRVEAELRESDFQLRLALKASRMGTWDWNIQTGLIRWSDNLEALFGLKPGEFDGSFEMFVARLHPDDRDRVLAAIAHAVATGDDYNIEFRVVYPNGRIRWALSQGKVFYDQNGQPIRMAGNDIDITARKQGEQRLQESEEGLRLAMQVTGFAVARFDYSSNTVELSPEIATLYGLPPEQLVVHREQIHATFHPEERAELAQIIKQVLDPPGAGWFARDHRVVWGNGEVRWLSVRKQVFFECSGELPKPTHAILVAVDITERKRAEQERELLLVKEQAARAEAERANRLKDEFLAILSHELRSPLNPILGWVKLMQARNFDAAKTTEALATIERNAKLQTQLIDDLLDIAKLLRGKLSMNVAPVNLVFVIEAALDTVRAAAIAKSLLLHPVLRQIGQVYGDATRLQQVVWNLLSNAIKFTPNNGRIDIRLERVGNQAQITVSDTGKGIKPEFLPHIFESFRQEDASTSRKYGGLGLGLAIVRHLVEAHGGTISADSKGEGQGATFTVRLPLVDTEPEQNQLDELPDEEPDLTGIRVLCVDDEPDTRELLTVLLTEYGAEVLSVASAAEVLVALESFQPDILVSDIGMPDVDGYTLLQQIRSRTAAQGGQIPAIALTAYAGDVNQQLALAVGFQQHIAKPIEPNHLAHAILKIIANG
jgi:PAS domain S-box-containing protein